jgi:Protein of unknown function (DUF732)
MPTSTADLARRDRRTTRVVVAVAVAIAVVVLVVVAISVVPRHSAPSADDNYLAAVQPVFPGVGASVLTKIGHDICTTFSRNPSDRSKAEYEIAKAAISEPDMPPAKMVSLIRSAVHVYCPSFESSLNQGTTTSLG